MLGRSDERYLMAGGSSSLIDAMTDRHRDRIELGRRPIRIAAAPGGRVTLTFLDLTTVTVDRVIVAVPASLADQIEYAVPLPTPWREFLKVMQLGRCEKLQWAMRDTPWRDTLGAGGEGWSADAAGPAALVWEGTVRGGASSGTPIWNWFFGGNQVAAEDAALPDPAVLARAFAGIARGLDVARAEGAAFNRTTWHRDPLTKGGDAPPLGRVPPPAGQALARTGRAGLLAGRRRRRRPASRRRRPRRPAWPRSPRPAWGRGRAVGPPRSPGPVTAWYAAIRAASPG